MVALSVVVNHEIGNGLLQFGRHIVIVELDNGFHRTVVTLNLALGLGLLTDTLKTKRLARLKKVKKNLRMYVSTIKIFSDEKIFKVDVVVNR